MTFAEKKIDYGLIPVIDVARELFGQERRERTTANERHFPDRGGLFVNLKKNRWYSHGNATGGDAIDHVPEESRDGLRFRRVAPAQGPHSHEEAPMRTAGGSKWD